MSAPILLIFAGAFILLAVAAWSLNMTERSQKRLSYWRKRALRKKPGPHRRAAEREAVIARMNWLRGQIGMPEYRA